MTDRDEDDAQAAEYVIGLMPVADRNVFEGRLRTDAALTAQVSAWQERLAPFNADYPHGAPPARVKAAIDRRLFERATTKGHWWPRLTAKWAAAGAALAAVVLALGLQSFQAEPELVAQLDPVEMGYRFAATYNQDTGVLTLATLEAVEIPDRVLELWAIGEARVPTSLGVVTSPEQVVLTTSVALDRGTTLAVSLEPLGGSPTGAPTGPVLSAGVLNDV
ncbi:anti-sigma factor [Roseobacter sp. A03A-229]